jgi:hypothetical protein
VPADDGSPAASRGVAGKLGRKLLKVLAFPLIDEVAGAVSDYFVGRWESAKRPYAARDYAIGNHTAAAAGELDGEGWRRLGEGPALLLVHGTFSRAHSAFGSMPEDLLGELHARYSGRVFAFDHFTLSHDPYENVRELVARIPDDQKLELDILCHSRGGLVSRVLAERAAEVGLGGRQITVRRVAFAGVPNAGTVLANAEHFGDLIDTVTNLLSFFPDIGTSDAAEIVIAVVKQLAVGAIKGLDGIGAMVPDGDFLKRLNTETDTQAQYLAVASNFEPTQPGLRDFVKDRLMDSIFSAGHNDLVVPTAGVYDSNGSSRFPIEERLSLDGPTGVGHTSYFKSPAVQEKLRGWLTG